MHAREKPGWFALALLAAACSRGGDVRTGGRELAAPGPGGSSSGPSGAPQASPDPVQGHAVGSASDLSEPAFSADFSVREPSSPWNVFGARAGNREVYGGAEGLWLKIATAEKAWDAVGMRTARIEVDGEFDLRAGFFDFSAPGNASAKLLVLDAEGARRDAAYVERIQIDGKNLLKFGGEVEGSLENWGFVPTEISAGELRLVRRGGFLYGYARPDNTEVWAEIGPSQAVPRSMPRLVKFGVRLSAEARKSAQVRFAWLTLRAKVLRKD
jgi:hypothetical protein